MPTHCANVHVAGFLFLKFFSKGSAYFDLEMRCIWREVFGTSEVSANHSTHAATD